MRFKAFSYIKATNNKQKVNSNHKETLNFHPKKTENNLWNFLVKKFIKNFFLN